ncbi:prepilin peptidase [Cryobacterium glucosi]|uniref:Prepilin leader peptidase/N-methyltransferase n=2 Tax=Cryobacterium glucosi TaxID=1259175 RepID=A0ABY2IRF0_9MICO|nr:A24 family peptidase [Cryobacterium glucosi]TFC20746.1 prepilin peptidase [Cryobacterium glucosi]
MDLLPVIVVLCAVVGLVVGSFLNVVIYRVPAGLSIVSPPSACPRCGAPILRRDNVPVLSWLALRGKCRNCGTGISARYPLVEAGTAVFFVVIALWAWTGSEAADVGDGRVGPVWVRSLLVLLAFLYLAAVSVALGLIDLDTHRLPNAIVLPSYPVGAGLLGAAGITTSDYAALIRAGAGLVILWALYLIMALVYPGGMGFGDVKLAGLLGLFLGYLGWGELAVGAFAAFLLGGFFALGLVVTHRATRKSGIPFGPWMLAGAWVGIFGGAQLWDGYLSLMGIGQ